jgi:hypothetical protein
VLESCLRNRNGAVPGELGPTARRLLLATRWPPSSLRLRWHAATGSNRTPNTSGQRSRAATLTCLARACDCARLVVSAKIISASPRLALQIPRVPPSRAKVCRGAACRSVAPTRPLPITHVCDACATSGALLHVIVFDLCRRICLLWRVCFATVLLCAERVMFSRAFRGCVLRPLSAPRVLYPASRRPCDTRLSICAAASEQYPPIGRCSRRLWWMTPLPECVRG